MGGRIRGAARFSLGLIPALLLTGHAGETRAQAHLSTGVTYKLDTVVVEEGRPLLLDNLDLTIDAALEGLFGWRGATAHVHVLNNSGAQPNLSAKTLQGIDNIEPPTHHVRLYEAWLEQAFAGDSASVRAGLYDLNSEFYVSGPAGLFLNPSFGIGPELAATGSGGPSIFPSTALAIRLKIQPAPKMTVMAAVLNAKAGTLGDPGGIDTTFDEGALIIGEVRRESRVNLNLGLWRYTGPGALAGRSSQGVYGGIEARLWGGGEGGPAAIGFVRGGVSDGGATPFEGGWQAGLVIERPLAGRPNSRLGLGVAQARISDNDRAGRADIGSSETIWELTYSDSLGERLTLQPGLQWVNRPGGNRAEQGGAVAMLRMQVAL